MAWLSGGGCGRFLTELPAGFPVGERGLLVAEFRAATAVDAGGNGAGLTGWSGPALDVQVREWFVHWLTEGLAAPALAIARAPEVASVVLCPAGAPQEATGLASLVATLLRARRGRAAVTCGVDPGVAAGGCRAVVWPVWVQAGDGLEERQVWELLANDDMNDAPGGPAVPA
ncbi:hypothetical protein I6A62_19520 [Frankia sp. AgW1.1]|nr:hypothetical protein [Frankia sp. AgB1.9]MBL7490222.1 hypothetical protein [Frankia sp. AgW1.1]MBL7623506.1 hypothetical protein [Frankia sp. AgB1.8]